MTENITCTPFGDQKPGTSGLRKKVSVFQQPHYTELFICAILQAMPNAAKGATLVVGGDGRFYSTPCAEKIISIAAAMGVHKLYIGQNCILSTPAASHVIRSYNAHGGILLTASHNPGGPTADFGMKFNTSNGGPAPESVTGQIFDISKTLTGYPLLRDALPDLSKLGTSKYGSMEIEVIDSVRDYVEMLKTIFDFDLIRGLVRSGEFKVLFDGLSGVTGPYARAIFLKELGLPESSVQNAEALPDFGGGHPDPNLTYAHSLVEVVDRQDIPFGAASDGDGDRNMIYGAGAFVTPSDSVAIIADWATKVIPYFKSGLKGLARSMPTSEALDRVAKAHGLECFEVPTGWKFFGNLMDAGRLSISGEESFGTGSDHIREKDGLWAIMAWLSILAAANQTQRTTIKDILRAHYEKYGRNFFSRYDYEEIASEGANAMMAHLTQLIEGKDFIGTTLKATTSDASFTVSEALNFAYTDPIDGSVTTKQGILIKFADGSRIVFRLSGTGSSGATARVYLEKYSTDQAEFDADAQVGLKPLIEVALSLSQLVSFTGREAPTVIT